jgi:Anti-sigma-K factor rskA
VAQRETANVVPFERPSDVVEAAPPRPVALPPIELERARRPSWPTLAALAIATGLAAIGLGAWAVFDEVRATPDDSAQKALDQSLVVLTDSSAVRYPLRGSVGRIALVVKGDGAAVLVVDGLGAAPAGMTYQVWVVPPGSATPFPDATFDAATRVVPLLRTVSPGTRVGVTLEPSSGSETPSRPIRLVTTRG